MRGHRVIQTARSGQRSLGDVSPGDLRLARRDAAVPLELVAHSQGPGVDETADTLSGALPHEVICRDLKLVSTRRRQTQHLLESVRFDSAHCGETVGVVDLGPHQVVLDELADWHQARGGAHEGVVRLTRGNLLRRGGSDVEPHG